MAWWGTAESRRAGLCPGLQALTLVRFLCAVMSGPEGWGCCLPALPAFHTMCHGCRACIQRARAFTMAPGRSLLADWDLAGVWVSAALSLSGRQWPGYWHGGMSYPLPGR